MSTIVLRLVALFFYSSLTLAQSFVFVEQHKGESSYVVKSGGLKSKLDFPFKFQTVGFGLNKNHQNIQYVFKVSKLAKNLRTTGKDYDWENDQLIIFSSSSNDVEDFFSIGLEVAKDITNYSAIFANFQYHKLDLLWSNTRQQNFVKDQAFNFAGDTLDYKQKFYQLNLGVSYQQMLTNNISLNIKPSVIFAFVESIDRHLLRNFYTVQDNLASGHGINITLSKPIDKDSTLSLSFNQEKYKDKRNEMDYYSSFTPSYSLPASYKYNTRKIGIFYQQQF